MSEELGLIVMKVIVALCFCETSSLRDSMLDFYVECHVNVFTYQFTRLMYMEFHRIGKGRVCGRRG